MASWVAMQRGHRAPLPKLLSLLVQVLHQALTQRFVPSTKGMKRDKRGDRQSYSSSPPHSFSRAFLYSPEVSSWKDGDGEPCGREGQGSAIGWVHGEGSL